MAEASSSPRKHIAGGPIWYLTEKSLRAFWHGWRKELEEFVLIYGERNDAVAIVTLLREVDWPDENAVAAFEPALTEAGVGLTSRSAADDVITWDSRRLFRKRLTISTRGIERELVFRDSSVDPAGIERQVEVLRQGSV